MTLVVFVVRILCTTVGGAYVKSVCHSVVINFTSTIVFYVRSVGLSPRDVFTRRPDVYVVILTFSPDGLMCTL